jgi:uncharacterized Zn-finger protein|uniref:C2H2-type domain-containing protein n=1 Tax=viral metagenome TaxID=1070528 RepID=A0A6C0HVT8_9ZZZZ
MENIKQYNCNICNKDYKSYKTFWYHNKTQHKIINDDNINKPEISLNQLNNDIKFICEYCNKIFTRKDNLDKHKKNSCKDNTSMSIINEKLYNIYIKKFGLIYPISKFNIFKFIDEIYVLEWNKLPPLSEERICYSLYIIMKIHKELQITQQNENIYNNLIKKFVNY